MLFTSYGFIAFIFVVLLLYYLVPKKLQWGLLLVASLGFYAISDPRYLLFVAVTAISAYFTALKMDAVHSAQRDYLALHKSEMTTADKKQYKENMRSKRRVWLLIGLLVNLGILCVTKYTNFVISTVNSLLSDVSRLSTVDLIIPMGISFYTFQTVSYVIDVYRGTQKAERNILKLALFVTFFPQMVQGPISRFGQLSETLYAEHPYCHKTVSFGIGRIAWGYFKKVVIADRLITAVTALVSQPESYTGTYVFVAMLFYAFELYCDFTGGIDITIGIAETMGIRVAENFNLPYFSKNIKEYWNRWHITMGTWFTDYIFYPISVCTPMLKLSKWSRAHLGSVIGKRVTVYLSSLAVWFTTGLWHGAAWNFIVWGLMNFVVIMISQELEPIYDKFHKRCPWYKKAPYTVFQIVRTILLMSAIRMFDCYRNVPLTFRMLGTMFTDIRPSVLFNGSLLTLGIGAADYIILAVGLAVVLAGSLMKLKVGKVREYVFGRSETAYYTALAVMTVIIFVFGAYGVGYDSSQFIYNQF